MDIWGLLIIPLAISAIIMLVTLRNKDVSSFLSIGAVVACFFIVLPYAIRLLGDPHMHPLEQSISWINVEGLQVELGTLIDGLSIIMLLVVTFVGSLIHIYSRGYMHGETGYSRFFASLSLFIFSMLGIVLSNNFIMIFIFWELVGVASYLLIGYYYEKPSAGDAAKKAFLVNRIGDFGFILGIIVLYYATGSFNFMELKHIIAEGNISPATLGLASLLIFCGAVGKSAQFPLHVWLPDAMEGPTPVSALIHAATMVVAGVYMLARTAFIFHASPEYALTVVAYVGGFTALMAALLALGQSDIKRVIAYSTLSSLGYMVMSIGVGSANASMFYLMTHAFFKALLFLAAGSVIHALHTNNIWEMGGIYPKLRKTGVTFILGSLAMMGIFPFSGFWSKDEILSAAYDSNMLLFVVGVITAFITAVFMTKLVMVTFFGEKRYHHEPHESPANMTIPLIILAFFAVIAGFAGFPGLDPNFSSFIPSPDAHGGAHGGGHHAFNYAVAFISTGAVFAGVVIGYIMYTKRGIKSDPLAGLLGPVYVAMQNRFYFDHFYDGILVARIYNNVAHISNFIEVNIIINFFVNGSAYIVRQAGKALRRTITGQLQHYALTMIAGALILMIIHALL
jgi:NADH-quinone oxidoreductase subunit L